MFAFVLLSCKSDSPTKPGDGKKPPEETNLPDIDLTHWYLTVPAKANDGDPITVEPPALFDYATNETIKPYFYNDSTDASLVFYTVPKSSTPNSPYSRTELREQMNPGSNKTNWTFKQGGHLKATESVPDIGADDSGAPYRTIIMQIHGRLTDDQQFEIGASDHNAPPVLKIYWQDGKIRVLTKVLENIDASEKEILKYDSWTDDDGKTFDKKVGNNKFTLEVNASEGKMMVTLDDDQTFTYDNPSLERWGIFENYFKVGNYLQSQDKDAYSYVKLYDLEVSH